MDVKRYPPPAVYELLGNPWPVLGTARLLGKSYWDVDAPTTWAQLAILYRDSA